MLPPRETAEPLVRLGLEAFTTTRGAGSFGTSDLVPVREFTARWAALRQGLTPRASRLATAAQVHGARVITHGPGWTGWLRSDAADGHATAERGTALAITIADCVPVFLAHPAGSVALLHAGWRGTVAGILARGVHALERLGAPAADIVAHFGPAICGNCYEVSPDVHEALTGRTAHAPTPVDLRAVLTAQAELLGLREVSSSSSCTRCGDSPFFSHRAGHSGRQLAVLVLPF